MDLHLQAASVSPVDFLYSGLSSCVPWFGPRLLYTQRSFSISFRNCCAKLRTNDNCMSSQRTTNEKSIIEICLSWHMHFLTKIQKSPEKYLRLVSFLHQRLQCPIRLPFKKLEYNIFHFRAIPTSSFDIRWFGWCLLLLLLTSKK